jgi:hypothetical protein
METSLIQILLEIFGQKYHLSVTNPNGSELKKIPALVSKNTKPGERPFRITWFNDQMIPYKHYDIDAEELKHMDDTHSLPKRVEDKILNHMNLTGNSLKLLKMIPDKTPINESAIHKAYKESVLRELEGKCDCKVRPDESGFVSITLSKDQQDMGEFTKYLSHNQLRNTDTSESPFAEILRAHDVRFAKKHRLRLHESIVKDGIYPIKDPTTGKYKIGAGEDDPKNKGEVKFDLPKRPPGARGGGRTHIRKFTLGKLGNIKPIFAAYVMEPNVQGNTMPKEDRVALRHLIKHPSSTDEKNLRKKMVKESVQKMAEKMPGFYDVDVIIPLGSKSDLNLEVANEISSVLKEVVVLPEALIKDVWKNAKVNDLELNDDGTESLGRKDARDFLTQRQKYDPDKSVEVKSISIGSKGRSARRYFSNFYKANEDKYKMIDMIKGKNVLLIDDTLEEGITLTESNRIIKTFEPKSVSAYIFLFGRNS